MRSAIVSSLFALAAVASAAAHGMSLNKRDAFLIVSPDGSCGVVDTVEYTCGGSDFGRCCGAMGVCGNDETSCSLASGCNPIYGDCDGEAATTSSTVLPTITPSPVSTVSGQTTTSTMGTPLLTSSTSSMASGNGTGLPTFVSTTMPMSTGTGASSGMMSGTGLPTGLNGTSTMLGSGTGLPTITSAPTPTGSGALMPGIISTLPITNPDVVCYVYTSLVTMTASVA